MKNYRKLCLLFFMLPALFFAGCEKGVSEDVIETEDDNANLVLRVKNNKVYPFETRALQDLTTYCSRLNFVVYKDGEKVASRTQNKGDEGYGEVSFSLTPGTYKLLVLAHSSYGGNPTVTDPEAITFTDKISYSDTFCYYNDIVVTAASNTHDLVLSRASTLLRFIIKDKLPSNLKQLRFTYSGGARVLNAVTGHGVGSDTEQTKLYNVSGYEAPVTLSLYTFLKEDTGTLGLTVDALDTDGNVITTRSFENIPVVHKKATEMSGNFFEQSNTFSITGDTEWEVVQSIDY